MKILLIFAFTLSWLNLTSCQKDDNRKPIIIIPGPPQDLGWEFETTPFWYDEFDYEGLPDPAKWGYDIGGHGWGNNELQFYTDRIENAAVANGVLTITARRENFEDREFTSTRLVSRHKGDILYGRVEVRCIVPPGRGTWPAVWMLPTDWEYGGWPHSGEIDIMEHVGHNPDVIHISTHTAAYYWVLGNQKTAYRRVEGATSEFQVYRVDWTPFAVRGFINGQHIFTHPNEGKGYQSWPFDKRFHVIMNVAVGGNWGGAQGVDPEAFPASLIVDYIRFYRMMPK